MFLFSTSMLLYLNYLAGFNIGAAPVLALEYAPGGRECQCGRCGQATPTRIDASSAPFGASDQRGRVRVHLTALTTVVLTNATTRGPRSGQEVAVEIRVDPGKVQVDESKLVARRRYYTSADPVVLSPCFDYMNNTNRSQWYRCRVGKKCWFLHVTEEQADRFFSGRSESWVSIGREVERILHLTALDRLTRAREGRRARTVPTNLQGAGQVSDEQEWRDSGLAIARYAGPIVVKGINLQVADLAGLLGLELVAVPPAVNRLGVMAEKLRLAASLTEAGELESARAALSEAVSVVGGQLRLEDEGEEIQVCIIRLAANLRANCDCSSYRPCVASWWSKWPGSSSGQATPTWWPGGPSRSRA